MFESILKNINLTADEIKVYELLLAQGEMSARQVIVGAGLKRGTAYYVLRGLKTKGLVEEFAKYKKSYFRLEPPSRLRDYIEGRVRQIKESSATLESALPEMLSQYNLVLHKPGIRFYEGKEGLMKIYEDTLRQANSEILVFRSIYDCSVLDNNFFDSYTKERAKKNINTKIFSPNLDTDKEIDIKLKKERRLLVNLNELETEIDIYGSKVAFLAFRGDNIGTIIESDAVASTMRKIFNALWNKV